MIIKVISIVFAAAALCGGCSGGSSLGGDSQDAGEDRAHEVDTPDVIHDSQGDAPDILQDDVRREETPDGVDPCLAQDARPEGPCAMELPGVVWNGERCVPLGSGCGCQGSDCSALYDSAEECVEARRVCYNVPCEAQPVADDMCLACVVSFFQGAFWDGRECFELWGCGCAGEGCPSAFSSIEECRAVQSLCNGMLCRETGGLWFSEAAGFCGFECGVSSPEPCVESSCWCGPGRTFVPGDGCRDDPSCTQQQTCLATRGRWHPASECFCGFYCGMPGMCDACLDSCDCGPHRNFDPEAGCVPDIACEGASHEEICLSTGGTWVLNTCGDYYCGFTNELACIDPGCDCGFLSNFDRARGCIYDEDCMFKTEGELCWARPACRAGLACCPYWSMVDRAYCTNPCCPDEPECDESGCSSVMN